MKLCQVIAVESKVKAKAHDSKKSVYQKLQKSDLLTGLSRHYSPKNDDGDKFPPESKKVQVNVRDCLSQVQEDLAELFDNTATKDWGNCEAKADVVVGEVTLLKDVPVPYLLFLEKSLVDIHTLVASLPTLDPTENWKWDANQSCWASEPKQTIKTKKSEVVVLLAPATDKHPAQVKTSNEDVLIGYWTTVNFSGANRVENLQKAVKFAREEANSKTVEPVKAAAKIFNYLFQK